MEYRCINRLNRLMFFLLDKYITLLINKTENLSTKHFFFKQNNHNGR